MATRPKSSTAHACAIFLTFAFAAALLGAASVLLGFDDRPFGWVILRIVIGLMALATISFLLALAGRLWPELTRE